MYYSSLLARGREKYHTAKNIRSITTKIINDVDLKLMAKNDDRSQIWDLQAQA